MPYIEPEQLRSFELGYKGIFANNFLIDLSGYYTSYTDFIGSEDYALKNPTMHQGEEVPTGTVYSAYVNSPQDVTSLGIGLGINV